MAAVGKVAMEIQKPLYVDEVGGGYPNTPSFIVLMQIHVCLFTGSRCGDSVKFAFHLLEKNPLISFSFG